MEFDELLITTGVDALVRLVKEKQRVEIEDASAILNIPVDTLEEWSRVLEEQGILRIEYRLTHIYLAWVKPTEEEIEVEKESFYEEKEDIGQEVVKIKESIKKETEGIEELQKSFADFYEKAFARIEKLEQTVSPLPAGKAISEGVFSDYQKELQQMNADLAGTKQALKQIDKEIADLGLDEGVSTSKQTMERMEGVFADMRKLQKEMQKLQAKAEKEKLPKDVKMPSMTDIKKKFEGIKKEFAELRSRNARMREDMVSLRESSEILQSVAESILGQEEKIQNLNKEVMDVAKETEELFKKVSEMDRKAKENADVIGQLGDSVSVAKNVVKKFPSQEKVIEELERLRLQEEKVLEHTKSLEKIIEAAGGKRVTAKQFAELTKKMDAKAKQVRRDMDTLESALEHEKSTYLTFQKIKERIVPAIESHRQKLAAMDSRIAKIREKASGERETLQKDAKDLQKKLKGGQMQGIMKVAEEIREKKKMLQEIKSSMDDLVATSDNLSKRVTLLSREAKLLEIRMGAAPAAGAAAAGKKAEEVRHELELSKQEELEFKKKREELRKLIKKLWETES